MRRAFGAIFLLFALVMICWVGYNLFIERHPVTEGRLPIPVILLIIGLLYVGIHWIRGERSKY